jgi:outer membrane receptor protein involved in Fe transport
VDQAGNATLIPATLHHVDGRYDFSPSLDQLVSIGAFYKYIRHPIENYILRGADNPILQFGQAASAYLVGVEVEVRLRLLKRLDVISNLALIYSQVDMGDRVRGLAGESQARYRPLYGQAPYIANLILTYTSPSQAWQITGALQQIGPRIFWVGDNLNPTVYEMPRLVNDLTIRRKLGRWYIQLQARDMLNQPFVYRQDTNLNGRIEKNEDIVIRYVRGSEWSVQVGVEW